MKKILIFVLSLLVIASPFCLAEEDNYISYTEHSLQSVNYTVPDTLYAGMQIDISHLYSTANGYAINITVVPFDDMTEFLVSDAAFCDFSSVYSCFHLEDDSEVGDPIIFPAPEGFTRAILFIFNSDVFKYYAANDSCLLTIETMKISASDTVSATDTELPVALMQIISSLSCTPSEE